MVTTLDENAAAASVTASKPALAFKITAFAEAVSWIGLLVGMFFKWVLQTGDVGVRIFGPIHGTIFIGCVGDEMHSMVHVQTLDNRQYTSAFRPITNDVIAKIRVLCEEL